MRRLSGCFGAFLLLSFGLQAFADHSPDENSDVLTAELSAAPQPGAGVKVGAQVTSGSVRVGSTTIPTWKVVVTIANYTGARIRLGTTMTILEKLPQREELVGLYIERQKKQAPPQLGMRSLRYALLWGATVEPDASAPWPLTALPGGSDLNTADAFMMVLSAPWVKPYAPDGGYPSVPAGRRITLREEFLIPLTSAPQYALLLPPQVFEEGHAPVQTVLRFNVGGALQADKRLAPVDARQYSAGDASRWASDATQPLWLRLHALNWCAESSFEKSANMLLRFASSESEPAAIRNASLLNLGLHQYKAAVPILVSRLDGKLDTVTRSLAVSALGAMGDASVAAQLRPLLNDSDEMLAYEAVTAIGKLKDAESVAALLKALGDGRREKQYGAVTEALSMIGTPDAWNGMSAVVADSKASFQARRSSALAMGTARYAPAVPVLARVLASDNDEKGVRMNMIIALSAIGGTEAWTAVRAASSASEPMVARSAVESIARSKDAANRAYLLEIAGTAGHPSRGTAIDQIKDQKIAAAAPVLKAALRDAATPAALLPGILDALLAIGQKLEGDDFAPLWSAYVTTKDSYEGSHLADGLIAARFADKKAVPALIAGLDDDNNRLWYSNVKLLRHLTGKKFGPEDEYSDKKERKAELDKWRAWWSQQPQ